MARKARKKSGARTENIQSASDSDQARIQEIGKLEDSTIKTSSTTTAKMQHLSLEESNKIPTRPGYSSQGTQIMLFTNHLEVKCNELPSIYRYSIDVNRVSSTVTPSNKKPVNVDEGKDKDGPKGKKLERIVHLVLQNLDLGSRKATDYRSTLFTDKDLGFQDEAFDIQYYPETKTVPDDNAPHYQVNIQFTRNIAIDTVLEYLKSTDIDLSAPVEKQDVLQALNIIASHGFKEMQWKDPMFISRKGQTGGANVHYPFKGDHCKKDNLSALLDVWRGFFLSMRTSTGRFLLLIQPKYTTAYKPGSLQEIIKGLQQDGKSFPEIDRILKKCPIQLTHFAQIRSKVMCGLASQRDGQGEEYPPDVPDLGSNATVTQFWWSDRPRGPGYVSVAKYFEQRYHVNLKHPKSPVINLGSQKSPSYTPAELCEIAPGTLFTSQLGPEETAGMIKHTVHAPAINKTSITEQGFQLLGKHSQPVLGEFGITLTQSLVKIPARVLEGPLLYYADNKTTRSSKAEWNMRQLKFSSEGVLCNWSVLWVKFARQQRDPRKRGEVVECVGRFCKTLRDCGISATDPTSLLVLELDRESDAAQKVSSEFKRISVHAKPVQFLLVILPLPSKVIRDAVKEAGDIQQGIHTVCVVGSKFANTRSNNVQYFANVALKINLKLGGVNQTLGLPDLGLIAQGKTMIVGLDVTHPSPGSTEKAPSVVGIVASADKMLGQWPAEVRVQTGRKEMIDELQSLFEGRLQFWKKKNKELPQRILVYRDGVSEGQYQLVRDEELPRIKAACKKVYPFLGKQNKQSLPQVTMVVVGKRHSTRFYPTDASQGDAVLGNTKNGTVVDRGITETRIWDFYLQAHTALKGTARPAHYVVVHDEIFRQQSKEASTNSPKSAAHTLEKITHNLCYMYGRATKAVSICPPVYYADLVCERARAWLGNVFVDPAGGHHGGNTTSSVPFEDRVKVHDRLKDTMFYI